MIRKITIVLFKLLHLELIVLLDVKKFAALSFLGIAISAFAIFEVNVFDFHHLLGRCEGSDYCRICTNCSRCGYCKGGGTCGVCYTPRPVIRRSTTSKSHRSERSVSSNSAHSFDSRTPSVKRYYLRKSLGKKHSPTTLSTSFDQSEREPFSKAEDSEPKIKPNTLSINQAELANDSQPIYSAPNIPEVKESFTVDIPENADFVRITAAAANLRENFTTKSSVLQRLKHGDLLIKLKTVKGWVKVRALDSGEVGYVAGNLLN